MSVQRAVLEATLEIIEADGPDSVSMREVARRARISHQAPYHHFGDRAGIFAAIAAEGFSILASEFETALEGETGTARRCFEVYVKVALQHPGHFRVMFRSDLNGFGDYDETTIAGDKAFAALLNMVERTIGRPGDDLASFIWATLLWSTAHGLSTLILDGPLLKVMPESMTRDSMIREVIDLMSEMVERQASLMGLLPQE